MPVLWGHVFGRRTDFDFGGSELGQRFDFRRYRVTTCQAIQRKSLNYMVPTEGVEPTHSHEYQILSLARLPVPPRRQQCANIFQRAAK